MATRSAWATATMARFFPRLVCGAVLEHVVDGDEKRVGHGHDGTLLPSPGNKVAVEGAEVDVRVPRRGPCSLDHGRPQPGVATTGPARTSLAGRLVVAGTKAGPGGEVLVGGEAAHVDADLGDDGLCAAPTQAGDGVDVGDGRLKRAHPRP